tara:strand:- start:64 stop:870 length:807 start_codon:yes stop_codon:yes gene_type:complete
MAVTVKRYNPTHPYCSNWPFSHGIVIGNGPSRHGLDLYKLRETAAIYGCNALYRDYHPDFLFANDPNMILEILRADYKEHCIFHEWDRLPMLFLKNMEADQSWESLPTLFANFHQSQFKFYKPDSAPILLGELPDAEEYGDPETAEDFIYIPHPDHMVFVYLSPDIEEKYTFVKESYAWGAGTGINALHYALEQGGHSIITLYGFDSFTIGSWSNIYDGTPQYKEEEGHRAYCMEKGIRYVPSHGEEWSEHIHTLKAAYPNVKVEMMA